MTSRFFVSQAIEGFELDCLSRHLSPNTIRDYLNTLHKFEKEFPGKYIDKVTRDDLRYFMANQSVSNKSLLNYYTGLSCFFKWSLSEKLISSNPAIGLTRPKPEIRVIEPIPFEHIKLIMAVLRRSKPYKQKGVVVTNDLSQYYERNRAIILLLLDTGLRVGELCSLKKNMVDLKSRNMKVLGKGNKERMVYYSPTTAQALWRLVNSNQSQYLFPSTSGRPLDRANIRHILSRLCERAGVPAYSPHDFRHTFAVNFLRNYPNIYALQQMLGHTTLDMVKRYLVISEQDLQKAHLHASPVENWGL